MGRFGDNNRFGGDRRGGNKFGGGNFGGRSFNRGGGDRERKQMFDAVCDNCGRNCKVPFEPTSGKPVFCSDCFEERNSDGSNFDRPEKRFSPNRRDFERHDDRRDFQPKDNNTSKLAEQVKTLNIKVDRMMQMLEKMAKQSAPKQKPAKEEAAPADTQVELTGEEIVAKVEKKIKKAKAKKASKEVPAENIEV